MGSPSSCSWIPAAARSDWIFCARSAIGIPHDTWSLAYENFPRTSERPDSLTRLFAFARSVVAASFGSAEPGMSVGITPAIRTAPGPAICRMP